MFSWDSGRGTKMLYLGRKINVTLKDSFLMSDFKHTGNKIFMALVWETLSANVYGKLKMVTNSLQFLLWALACSLRLHLPPAPEFESGLMTNRTQLSCAEWLQCPSQEKTTDFSLHLWGHPHSRSIFSALLWRSSDGAWRGWQSGKPRNLAKSHNWGPGP